MTARTRRQVQLAVALVITTLLTLLAASSPALAVVDHDPGSSCDELVTYTTDGAQGDERSVAITSQSLEAGVPGWEHISWQAAPSTHVVGVVVTTAAGTTVLTDGDLGSGLAEGVLAITFCGAVVDDATVEVESAEVTSPATTSGGHGGTNGGTIAAGDGDERGTAATAGAVPEIEAARAPAASVLGAAVAVDPATKALLAGTNVDAQPAPSNGTATALGAEARALLAGAGADTAAASTAAGSQAGGFTAAIAAAIHRHRLDLALGALIGLLAAAATLVAMHQRRVLPGLRQPIDGGGRT